VNTLEEDVDPYCLAPSEAAELLRRAPWQRVVVVGDSVAAGVSEHVTGYRDVAGAERVRDALSATRPVTFANLGQRDLRVAEIAERQLHRALEFGPDLTIVAAGANDAFRRSFNPEQVRIGLLDLVWPLQEAASVVALIGLFDLARSGLVPEAFAGAMAERFDALDAVSAGVASELGCVLVDNHSHPLARDPAIFASDNIHCNARGHAVAATNCVRALHRSLESGRRASPAERMLDGVGHA
jgi:lysophospholipase L1-like esterase